MTGRSYLVVLFLLQSGVLACSLLHLQQQPVSGAATGIRKTRNHGFIGPRILGTDATQGLKATTTTTSTSASTKAATALGYFMGTAALWMYLPLILKIVKAGNADGFSLQTWMTTVASFSLALLYPIKRKFPLSSYIELLGLQAQSIVILGLICFYSSRLFEFFLGMGLLSSIFSFIFSRDLSPRLLSSIQVLRLALDSYSLLPQIFLNFQNSLFSYSEITASMGLVGNAIRVYTTSVLVKDPLLLSGYVIGALCNLVLLAQFLLFRGGK